MTNTAAIELKQLKFAWKAKDWKAKEIVLDIPQLQIPKGEQVFLRGASGSGKSTLLNLLGGLMSPQQGQIKLLDQALENRSQRFRDRFRADHIGVLFQQFNLLPYLNLVDNVTLPCRFSTLRRQKAGNPEATAKQLLEALGLAQYIDRPIQTAELSIGQQQRVAAARALIGQPEILLADEPTSALDSDTRDQFLSLLSEQCAKHQMTLVFVSHDVSLSHHFDRVIDLSEINQVEATPC
ncbi:ABC transporter ATP-binding protein [Nitrincola schmidtii]|uniref:ABC transporter ATP-binding protein n=1 Tax=Nitrincola schmidtii TaxID=1730894 RepID=UPI00124CCD0E|nr:ABC transporter ATP-binding protein [Nitrincola schmidtii]